MSGSGVSELYIQATRALLDAVEALRDHLDALVLVGAQAVYIHTGAADVAIATSTKDSDIALDPGMLDGEPLLEEAMRAAGFELRPEAAQPGEWISRQGNSGRPTVPEALGGGGGRAARIAPHHRFSARKVLGLEAALIDNQPHRIESLETDDQRVFDMKVAGPAALIIAKLHKIGVRQAQPRRLNNKDAHDIYRLLRASDTTALASTVSMLNQDDLASQVTAAAVEYLNDLFSSPTGLGSTMAGDAERGVGNPDQVAVAASALAMDLIDALPT